MSGAVLLFGGLGALGLALATLVMAVLPGRSQEATGVAGALARIERHYAQPDSTAGRAGADPVALMPFWLRGLAVRLSPSGMATTLQRRLDLAGNPPAWTPDRIFAAKGLLLLGCGALGGLYTLRNPVLGLLWAVLAGAAGFFLPDLLLYNSGLKRQQQIQRTLPDALDMLTVCVEAGLGFDAALSQVARNAQGPLAGEFARVLQEMQIGKSRSEALRAMADRTTVPELRSFVSALVQAGELGIAVARVLREQAREMRLRRRQRAEERAQKLPIKILFPLITCLFPALFVVILGPAVITISNTLFGSTGVFHG